MNEPILIFCTVPDEITARRLGGTLVNNKLAACVNYSAPSCSIYRWKGTVEEANEILLTIKTVKGRYEAVEMLIRSIHPYEVPEIMAIPVVRGLTSYLEWLQHETLQDKDLH